MQAALCAAVGCLLVSSSSNAAEPAWRTLADGVEYATLVLAEKPSHGDGKLHVVRLDASKVELAPALASEHGGEGHTAAEWTKDAQLLVAINAGMYATDQVTNVGYLRHGAHLNQPAWNSYQSVLVIGPRRTGLPAVEIIDLDSPGARARIADYQTAVQNLRMVKGEGTSVWGPSDRKWSEASIAIDQRGRLLLLFAGTPLSVHDFNARILQLPLGIAKAMHVEGGPEASLSIHAGDVSIDLYGGYETGFWETRANTGQWKIPNVIGVRALNPHR